MYFGELTGRGREPSAGPWQKTSFQQKVFWTLLMWACCFVRSHLVSQSNLCASADGSRSSGIQNPKFPLLVLGTRPWELPLWGCADPLHPASLDPTSELFVGMAQCWKEEKFPKFHAPSSWKQGAGRWDGVRAWSRWDGVLRLWTGSHNPQLF